MTEGPTADGLVNYLIYMVVGLVSVIFGIVQKHFSGRMDKMEENCTSDRKDIRKMDELWHKKFEQRRLENKEDFRLLQKKVEDGHAEILTEIRSRR